MKSAFLLPLALFLVSCASTPQPANRVRSLERITLGGIEQTILIHGDSAANPLLLFVHGGPGLPNRPFTHADAALERDFLIVDWDQRGAGLSYDPAIPRDSMTIDQFVTDTLQLSRQLSARFSGKIHLVGHSWGSLIAALAASRAPELFHDYIGLGQLVDVPESESILHQVTLAEARAAHDSIAERKINAIGPPPYRSIKDERAINAISKKLRPPLPHPMTPLRIALLALTSPDYSIFETRRVLRGIRFSGLALRDQIYAADLRLSAPEIRVPVFFLLGRHDLVLSPDLTVDYCEKLRAPQGKQLIWFEHADHYPHLDDPAEYVDVLRRIKAEVETFERTGQPPAPIAKYSSS